MDCPHCGKAFHDTWDRTDISEADTKRWTAKATDERYFGWDTEITTCPACGDHTILLQKYIVYRDYTRDIRLVKRAAGASIQIYPQSSFRKPTPAEVPASVRADYKEACEVLPISQKASATLSRRCLQAILREQDYPQKDLVNQIDALLKESDSSKSIPTALRSTVDAIRNFGNFSAHPITDVTTLQIIPVDQNEAEWCLELLEELFDHYYVRPALAKARKAALDAKLKAGGKPPSK